MFHQPEATVLLITLITGVVSKHNKERTTGAENKHSTAHEECTLSTTDHLRSAAR